MQVKRAFLIQKTERITIYRGGYGFIIARAFFIKFALGSCLRVCQSCPIDSGVFLVRRNANFDVLDKLYYLYNHTVMKKLGYINNQNSGANLDAIFSALADPTRRQILSRLADGEASVQEIAQPFTISQPAISKHLKVLERAGLVERDIDEQRRPARLKAENMAIAVEWLEHFRNFWGKSFVQLDDLLVKLQNEEPNKENGNKV